MKAELVLFQKEAELRSEANSARFEAAMKEISARYEAARKEAELRSEANSARFEAAMKEISARHEASQQEFKSTMNEFLNERRQSPYIFMFHGSHARVTAEE
eukprot:gene3793-2688_t